MMVAARPQRNGTNKVVLEEKRQGSAVTVDTGVCVSVLLDTSGSMSGTRIRAALDGCCSLVQSLQPTDLVTLRTFGSAVTPVFSPRQPESVDLQQLRRTITVRRRRWHSTV